MSPAAAAFAKNTARGKREKAPLGGGEENANHFSFSGNGRGGGGRIEEGGLSRKKERGGRGGLGRAGPQSWAEVATDSPLPTRFKIEHSLVSKKQFNFPSSAVLTKQMHYFHPFKGRSQRLGKRVMQRPN